MSRLVNVRNPRTGALEPVRMSDAADVAAVCERVRAAQPRWSELGLTGRIRALQQWADAVDKAADRIAEALAIDTGRWTISRNEAHGVGKKVRRWCEQAPAILEARESVSKIAPNVAFQPQYVPYPLVGVISPWNFPLTLALIDALPALVAGCSVVVKPSELTPRFVAPLRETIAASPELAAVFDVLAGDGDVGEAIVESADMVCFTGSVATGRKIAAKAARRFIPVFLELGGKDPAIVLKSADLERAADAVLRQGLVNSGQVCLSIERVYADQAIFADFVSVLTRKAEAIELNVDNIRSGHLGPIISATQADLIAGHLADAVKKGARIQCGGEILERGGKWLPATVLTNVDHDMRIMREETFGPVIPVMSFARIDEAVALANDSEFGLSAAVFAADEAEALEVARRIDAGAVSINDAGLQSVTTEAEKTSFKFSGLGGSRMGAAGLTRFFRKKALMIQRGAPRTMADFAERSVP